LYFGCINFLLSQIIENLENMFLFKKKQEVVEQKKTEVVGCIELANYRCITIGVSAGGTKVLTQLLPQFPANFALPIVIIQHLHPNQGNYFIQYYGQRCNLNIKEAEEKELIKAGNIYFAPPNYHLFIEDDFTFSLSVDEKVNYSRPSIDVFFMSAADVFTSQLIGVILTGANYDGANGLKKIKDFGGLAIVQDPSDAEARPMPSGAISATKVDFILPASDIGILLTGGSVTHTQITVSE